MADYYPLIARAIAGLDKNTGEARRALYERARTALVAQLRGVNPPLQEAEITRERLALEEAIRKVEAEAARRSRIETTIRNSRPRCRQLRPPVHPRRVFLMRHLPRRRRRRVRRLRQRRDHRPDRRILPPARRYRASRPGRPSQVLE